MNANIAELSAKLEQISTTAAASSSAAATSTSSARAHETMEATVTLGGFLQETPRGMIDEAFRTHALPQLQASFPMQGIVLDISYIFSSSSLQAKCCSA